MPRPIREEKLEEILEHADHAREVVLDEMEFVYPEGGIPNDWRHQNMRALWNDRCRLVRLVGELSGNIYTLMGHVDPKDVKSKETSCATDGSSAG